MQNSPIPLNKTTFACASSLVAVQGKIIKKQKNTHTTTINTYKINILYFSKKT